MIELEKKSISKPQKLIALEIKYSKTWDRRWSATLAATQAASKNIGTSLGVYLGEKTVTHEGVTILPVKEFLNRLFQGKIF